MPALPRGTKFVVPKTGFKKYQALIPVSGKIKRVSFGDRRYQQYKDTVPKSMGGGKWTKKNHGDKDRRANYRSRHGGMRCKNGKVCIKVKNSPAWFSYHFLW
jgi:hypothetical protein